MSGGSSPILREGALWGGAAALVLAAHLGGGLWLLHSAKAATPQGLPDPVFVDLAPMPQAAAPLDAAESPELAAAEPEPEPEIDLPLPELEQVPDMNTLFPPPPEAVVLQKSTRPKDRPEEPEPKLVKKDPEPKKKREKKPKAPEKQQARKATTQLQAPKAQRTAAPRAEVGTASPRQVASWQSKVNAAVARHMQRARMDDGGGAVVVSVNFTLTPSGKVAGARLVSSTGNARNDAELSRQAARMPRLPAHPSGTSINLTLPVRIQM